MKTAREAAEEYCRNGIVISVAGIEALLVARDAEHASQLKVMREALEAVAKVPTIWSHDAASGHYDTGRLDAYEVRRLALEALAAIPEGSR